MKLTQLAQMTPAQDAWCATADDAHRQAFILGGEIKVLAGLGPDMKYRFTPIIHGIRVRLEDQPASHATPDEAQAAGEALKAKLQDDLNAAGVILPELDLAALGLEDQPDEDEVEIEDKLDLTLAMLDFGNLELLEVDEGRSDEQEASSSQDGTKTAPGTSEQGPFR